MGDARHVVCSLCERAFPIFKMHKRDRKQLLRDPNRYVCDNCRMHASNPRAMQPQHIQILNDWEPDETDRGKCPYCGAAMWKQEFRLLVDREVVLDDNDIAIKVAEDMIHHYECPNPECEKGWGRQPQHRYTMRKLCPPWAEVIPSMFPGLKELPLDEQGPEFHRRWWFYYNKERARNAGKGVTLKSMIAAE